MLLLYGGAPIIAPHSGEEKLQISSVNTFRGQKFHFQPMPSVVFPTTPDLPYFQYTSSKLVKTAICSSQLCCSDSPKMMPHPCRIFQKCTTFEGFNMHPLTFLKSPSNIGSQLDVAGKMNAYLYLSIIQYFLLWLEFYRRKYRPKMSVLPLNLPTLFPKILRNCSYN
ncbi:hypothetical protein H5410_026506 [Solanum commersonii]|uniref:Uncharacterized protein n=1 Tax=Solanum commersonii TaxID=4109 RepID=A0A9J5Z1Q9_SOLCO|nr:hypothetical protein H5410_026506 [Solanum commersonii]